MGQPVTVIEKPSSHPGVVRYETNRVLTGMGHDLIARDRAQHRNLTTRLAFHVIHHEHPRRVPP